MKETLRVLSLDNSSNPGAPYERFTMEGEGLVLEEENLGIANGRLFGAPVRTRQYEGYSIARLRTGAYRRSNGPAV